MKIVVLHGEDLDKSYLRLTKFIETARNRGWEVTNIASSPRTFQETLSETSLFGVERFFILNDIKKLGRREIKWLNDKYETLPGNLIIYRAGIIDRNLLKSLPGDPKVEEYKLQKLIWNFLDSLYPGNSKNCVESLHNVLKTDSSEFVFALIAKQFRDLYWVRVSSKVTQFPSWRLSKLKNQAQKFSIDLLKKIISELSAVDIKSKTGKTDLISSLDLLIFKHLE